MKTSQTTEKEFNTWSPSYSTVPSRVPRTVDFVQNILSLDTSQGKQANKIALGIVIGVDVSRYHSRLTLDKVRNVSDFGLLRHSVRLSIVTLIHTFRSFSNDMVGSATELPETILHTVYFSRHSDDMGQDIFRI